MSVFVPAHITGFFSIMNNDNVLLKGSVGGGFLLDKGVKTGVCESDEFIFDYNQGSDVIIRKVLEQFNISRPLKITQDIQLPVGAGFGTSAASALSLSLALNEFLEMDYSFYKCGQIAHSVEISLSGGLGDVIAQTGRGIVFRTSPGAPGIGKIQSYPFDAYVGWKSFGQLSTSDIINNPDFAELISDLGLNLSKVFMSSSDLKNFLKCSYDFAVNADIMSGEVSECVEYARFQPDILGASMAMLGNTVFIFASKKESLEKLEIDDLEICKLNNTGICYD